MKLLIAVVLCLSLLSCAAQTPYGNLTAQDGNRVVIVDSIATTIISARSDNKDVVAGNEEFFIIIKEPVCSQE